MMLEESRLSYHVALRLLLPEARLPSGRGRSVCASCLRFRVRFGIREAAKGPRDRVRLQRNL